MAGNEKLRSVCGSIIESFRNAEKDYSEKINETRGQEI